MDTYDPRLGTIWLYALFLNDEDAKAGLFPGGWLNELLAPIAEAKQNVRIVGPAFIGTVGFSNTKQAVRVPSDLGNLKIRAAPMEAVKRQIGNLAPNVVSISFGEVFTALQLGTADGSVNGPHTTLTYFGDVIKHYTHMKIHYEDNPILLNLDRWNSFPPDIQKIYQEEMTKMSEDFCDAILAVEDQDLDAMEAKGIDVIRYTDLTEAERKAWIEAARDFYPELEDLFGKDFLDLVVSKASKM